MVTRASLQNSRGNHLISLKKYLPREHTDDRNEIVFNRIVDLTENWTHCEEFVKKHGGQKDPQSIEEALSKCGDCLDHLLHFCVEHRGDTRVKDFFKRRETSSLLAAYGGCFRLWIFEGSYFENVQGLCFVFLYVALCCA